MSFLSKMFVVFAVICSFVPVMAVSADLKHKISVSPATERKVSNKIKPGRIKKDPAQIISAEAGKQRNSWQYNVAFQNPKNENLLLEVIGVYPNNRLGKVATQKVSGKKTGIMNGDFVNEGYKSLNFYLYKVASGKTFADNKQKVDSRSATLPKIRAEITKLNVSSAPNKSWSYVIKNTTSVPMKFNVSLIEEAPNGTNHGIANYNTGTIPPNGLHEKNGILGYLKKGNNLSLGIRHIPNNAVLDSESIKIQ